MDPKPPDVVVLGKNGASARCCVLKLIEGGYEVVVLDARAIPRLYRRPGMKPRVDSGCDVREIPEAQA
jgi:hypothetical protein